MTALAMCMVLKQLKWTQEYIQLDFLLVAGPIQMRVGTSLNDSAGSKVPIKFGFLLAELG